MVEGIAGLSETAVEQYKLFADDIIAGRIVEETINERSGL